MNDASFSPTNASFVLCDVAPARVYLAEAVSQLVILGAEVLIYTGGLEECRQNATVGLQLPRTYLIALYKKNTAEALNFRIKEPKM